MPFSSLAVWQAGHHLGIEHGKARPRRRHVENPLLVRGLARDHGGGVRFRAGRRQRQHDAYRQRLPGRMPAADDIPAVAVVERGAGDVLGAIRHRAATDAEDEIGFLPFCEVDRSRQGFQRRVGFHAGEFDHLAPGQRGHHLVVNTIAFDRAAAV